MPGRRRLPRRRDLSNPLFMEDLSEQIHTFLESISLADLVAKNEVKKIADNQDRRQIIVTEMSAALAL